MISIIIRIIIIVVIVRIIVSIVIMLPHFIIMIVVTVIIIIDTFKVLKMSRTMKYDDIKESLNSRNNHPSLSKLDQQNIKEYNDEK